MKDVISLASFIYTSGQKIHQRYQMTKENINECDQLMEKMNLALHHVNKIKKQLENIQAKTYEVTELKVVLTNVSICTTECEAYIDSYLKIKTEKKNFKLIREMYNADECQKQFAKLTKSIDYQLVTLNQALTVLIIDFNQHIDQNVGLILEMLRKVDLSKQKEAKIPEDMHQLEKAAIAKQKNNHFVKARELYEKAVALGSARAMANLGFMMMTGKGGPKDSKRAIELCMQSAARGFPRGIFNLAQIHFMGIGTKINQTKAVELYVMAIQAGSEDAAISLQKLDGIGKGVTEAAAQFMLGKLYETGEVQEIKADLEKAKNFYKRAKEQGHLGAAERLEALSLESFMLDGMESTGIMLDDGLGSAGITITPYISMTLMGSSSSSSSSTSSTETPISTSYSSLTS